jgi:hypothetical protein
MNLNISFKKYINSKTFKYDLLIHCGFLTLILSILFIFVIKEEETKSIKKEINTALDELLESNKDKPISEFNVENINIMNSDVGSGSSKLHIKIIQNFLRLFKNDDQKHQKTLQDSYSDVYNIYDDIYNDTKNDLESEGLSIKNITEELIKENITVGRLFNKIKDNTYLDSIGKLFITKDSATYWYNKNVVNTVICIIIIIIIILVINFYSSIKNNNIKKKQLKFLFLENLLCFLTIGMIEMIFFLNVGLKFKPFTVSFIIEKINENI